MKMPEWIKDGRAALAIGALAIGVGMGTYLTPYFSTQAVLKDVRDFQNSYHFINPLLACGADGDLDIGQARALKQSLQAVIAKRTQAGDITDASIYFRDLNNGPWVGINYDEKFSPSSLLKVPLAMSVFKKAEDDPSFWQKKFSYTGTEVQDFQHFPPARILPAGNYTVEELVRQMLQNSDNDATNILANAVGADSFTTTYAHLGISIPPVEGTDFTTTTHSYSSFFRILYSGTYLSDASSERLLALLSETNFTQGLVAGLPSTIPVAHKFGERSFSDSSIVQLHDCGIVYLPKHPYVICVMTKGTNFDTLASVIAELSRTTYQYVTSPVVGTNR